MTQGTYRRCGKHGCRKKKGEHSRYCPIHQAEDARIQLNVSPRYLEALEYLIDAKIEQALEGRDDG